MNLLKPKAESDWHPHGCVKVDLSELWLGQTSLEFYIPVVPCHASESVSSRIRFFHPFISINSISGRGTNSKRMENLHIQQGDFLSSGTQMKIVVKLAKSLVPPVEPRLFDDRNLPTTTVRLFLG
jgi:hypothetical protein